MSKNLFNSKVIKKSFVPELFFVLQDSYAIYEHFMNIICTFHIFMYSHVTIRVKGYIYIYIYIYICRKIDNKVIRVEGEVY